MAKISVNNEQVLKDAIGVYAAYTKKQVERLLTDAATETMAYIDNSFQPLEKKGGNNEFPVWDGDLRDSTGVCVYADGRLIRYKLSPFAKYGTQWLDAAFDAASSDYSSKSTYTIQLFSAVPYAEDVNTMGSPIDRGIGFFENISDFMSSWVRSRMGLYTKAKVE